MQRPLLIRSRQAQLADRLAVEDLVEHALSWEPWLSDQPARIYERGGRLIGASWSQTIYITAPTWHSDPLPEIPLYTPGDQLALIGRGLCIDRGVELHVARQIRRLARTLRGDELGARWVLVQTSIPEITGFDAAGAAQQICAGAVTHPPIVGPLEDGFWPIGINTDRLIMAHRNDAF